MEAKNALIALIALLLVSALAWMLFNNGDAASVVNWNDEDEVAVSAEELRARVLDDGEEADIIRAEVTGLEGTPGGSDEARPLVTIKGRVVNKHSDPIANAKVNLTVQGRGRSSRFTLDVTTKSDGSFAFSGKAFTRLWVTLEVSHRDYATATAFKNFNDAKGSLDTGDIKVYVGGTIIGSVTDMQGNTITDATAELNSMDRGRGFRRGGNRSRQPKVNADRNGIFRITKIPPGRYRVTATAPHRQRVSESPITVVDEQESRISPIQLGPGFELTGIVFDPNGRPIKDADVRIRGSNRRNREQNDRTDTKGEFAFSHLPPGEYGVRVRAKGYLTNEAHQGIKVTEAPPLSITMQTGLRIVGVVMDGVTGRPVTSFGARIQRVASLPNPEQDRQRAEASEAWAKLSEMRGAMRDGKATPEQQKEIVKLTAELHGAAGGFGRDRGGRGRGGRDGGGRGRGGRDGSDRGRGNRDGGRRGSRNRGMDFSRMVRGGWGRSRNSNIPGDTGDVQDRPDGGFEFDGLEEGIYVVDIGSPDHQRLRSERIELSKGLAAPTLTLVVHRGMLISGKVVTKADKAPLRNVNVELRMVVEPTEESRRRENERSRDGGRRNDIFRQIRGNGPRTTRLLSARSKPDGSFSIAHAPAGKYVLRAEMDGYTTLNTKEFQLRADSPGFEMALGALGMLEGRVAGLPHGKVPQARVMAYSASPRAFRDAEVKPDGTYEITGLEPGGYIVRAFLGDARSYIFRQMFRGMSSQENQQQPIDIQIREGGHHHFNVTITAKTTGTVRGEVFVNGKGATGYRVSLLKIDNTQVSNDESRAWRGFRGFGNSASVDQNGKYEIKDIEMGQYTLTITPLGGGRGFRGRSRSGSNEINRQTIHVNPEAVTQVPLVSIQIGALVGTVKIPAVPDSEVKTTGEEQFKLSGVRVTLYQGVTVVPDSSQPGYEDVLKFSTRVSDNKFEFKNLPVAEYLLLVRASGRDTVTKTIYVGSGEETRLDVEAGPLRQKKNQKTPVGTKPTLPGKGTTPGSGGRQTGRTGRE